MILHIFRHGIAIDRDDPASPPEEDRFLTPKGVARTEAAAQGLRVLGLKPEWIFTSPFLRAVQTAEIACEALSYPVKKLQKIDALKSEAEPAELFHKLSGLKAEEVLCVGHAPHVDNLIAFAVRSQHPITSLKKAGLATLEIASFSPPRSTIVGIYSSKVLRRLAR